MPYKKYRLVDKLFYFPMTVLGIYFIIRFIDYSKLSYIFPLDYTNDISSYMAQLFFLDVCGFHKFCPYWYNGFITFQLYPPGWFFFTYPIYLVTHNVLISTYISLLLIFILGFTFLFLFLKKGDISNIKVLAFFLFFFGNAVSLGNYLRLGRITELFAFVFFVALAGLILAFKDRDLNPVFLLSSLFFFIILLSHQSVAFLSLFLFFSLFLLKDKIKEKVYIISSLLFGLILSSFWLIPYLINVMRSNTLSYKFSKEFGFSGVWLLTTIAAIIVTGL